jgi:hypothetical protein
MNLPICDGQIVLNVDGQRYTASFRFERGVVTVTCGSVCSKVKVGDVEDPKSVARTLLRTMVEEDCAACASTQANAIQAESKERKSAHDYFLLRPYTSMRHARTRH